jgi:hypothetical protein
MNTTQHACNYALLRYLPYPETGEFVNVGVLVACRQPCLLDFVAERKMPERAKTLFRKQSGQTFEAALEALRLEMERVKCGARDPKSVQSAFNDSVRARESVFRFGEVRTILTADPSNLCQELFVRYVRMEETAPDAPRSFAV